MLKSRLILLAAFFTAITVHALPRGLAITQYPHGVWSTSLGLPADSIKSITQTKDGSIWVATSGGLARLNHRSFETFTTFNTPEFKTGDVTALLKDRNGSLWIGTEGGGLLNYENGKFKVFTIDDGLSDNSIRALAQDSEGKIWIVTPVDVNIFDQQKFTSAPLQQAGSIFAQDDRILVGTKNGLSIVQKGKVQNYPGKAVTAVYAGKSEVYLGVQDTGLCRLRDGKIEPLLATEEIQSILQDRDGNVWLGTVRGIRMFVPPASSGKLHPDISTSVPFLYEDREGIIWAATSGQGLHNFRPSAFAMITAQEGLTTSRTWCVLQDRSGAMWIGTDAGISRSRNGEITNFAIPSAVRTITQDSSGVIWIGTNSGVFRKQSDSFELILPGLVTTAMIAGKDAIWIGSLDGLRLFSRGKLEQVSEEEITALFLDSRNDLWAGTKNGLKRWNDDALEDTPITGEISVIQQVNNGSICAGFSQSIQCIQNGKVSTHYIENAFTHPAMTALLEDAKGDFWIGSTSDGVLRVRMEKGKLIANTFKSVHGLLTTECATGHPAAAASPDGNFWFATVNGVAVINPENYFVNKIPPPVVIERVEVDRVPLRSLNKEEHRFPAETSRIEFQFAGLSFLPGVQYRYVLQGFDQFWTNSGGQNRAVYTNLPPGKYRFKVLAANSDDAWNIAGASLAFQIESPGIGVPNRTFVFPLVAAIVGFLAGWLLRSYRPPR